MKIENIVTSIEISQMLKNAGYNKKSIFSYFKNKDNHIYISETNFSKDEFIAFAYTSTELGESLPSKLKIDNNTFVANFKNYTNITNEEIEKYDAAYLISLKETYEDSESQHFIKYSIGERMIAFSQTLEGNYRNLFRSGNSEMECRAKMIIALIEEEKI